MPIRPDVTPAMASSLVCAVDILCKSMLRERLNTTSIGALMLVESLITGALVVNSNICVAKNLYTICFKAKSHLACSAAVKKAVFYTVTRTFCQDTIYL